jgi:hypothetical protein
VDGYLRNTASTSLSTTDLHTSPQKGWESNCSCETWEWLLRYLPVLKSRWVYGAKNVHKDQKDLITVMSEKMFLLSFCYWYNAATFVFSLLYYVTPTLPKHEVSYFAEAKFWVLEKACIESSMNAGISSREKHYA